MLIKQNYFLSFFTNILIPKNIINNPTIIFNTFDTDSGIKPDKTVPSKATNDKNKSVAEINPIENITNYFYFNPSLIIFVVKTLSQKTIVIGLDNVNINPCIKILAVLGFKFNPGIKLH